MSSRLYFGSSFVIESTEKALPVSIRMSRINRKILVVHDNT